MATITSTPTGGSLTVNGTTQVSGTISWSKPTIPSGATINSCVLTGTATASMSKGSATITVNGTTVTSGSNFTINLGTANNTTSVTTTAKGGNKQSKGTVSFSNLVYTVTYEEAIAPKPTYTVTFKDWDGTTLKTQTVEEGSSATAPSNPSRAGYNFTGWDKSFNTITANITITAQYSIKTYTVIFKDDDGSTLKTQTVNHGSNATAPSNPSKEGYTFTGWDKSFNNVTSDLTVTAQYTKNNEPEPEIPEGATPVEKTVALRPISATQDSGYNNTWTNIANTYDTDTSTNGTIIVTGSSQTGFKRKYVDTIFNFDNPIPANATINSAVLTIRAKQSATTNLNITVSIDSHEVIGSTLLSSSSANYTADVANYVKDLNQLNINLTSAATSNRTFTLYDVRIDVNYSVVETGGGEDPEEDIIEWIGLGAIATGLKAHAGNDGYFHDNYKINLDWENESFDIIITDELGRSSSYSYNIGSIGDIKIGDNKFSILFSDGAISIYSNNKDNVLEYYNSDYGYYPFVVSFTKKGIYVKSSAATGEYSTSELLSGSENIYEINQPIYLIDDGLIHSSVSNQENPKYDILFDLAVSEYSEQTEEPDNNELVQGDINEDGSFNDESTTVVRTKYIDISDKKAIQVNVLTDNVYISACYLYNANKELVKVIEIPVDKKRQFGVNLQKLIAQIIKDEGGDQ